MVASRASLRFEGTCGGHSQSSQRSEPALLAWVWAETPVWATRQTTQPVQGRTAPGAASALSKPLSSAPAVPGAAAAALHWAPAVLRAAADAVLCRVAPPALRSAPAVLSAAAAVLCAAPAVLCLAAVGGWCAYWPMHLVLQPDWAAASEAGFAGAEIERVGPKRLRLGPGLKGPWSSGLQ